MEKIIFCNTNSSNTIITEQYEIIEIKILNVGKFQINIMESKYQYLFVNALKNLVKFTFIYTKSKRYIENNLANNCYGIQYYRHKTSKK